MDAKYLYLTPLIVIFGATIIHTLLASPTTTTKDNDNDDNNDNDDDNGEGESIQKPNLNRDTNSNTDDDNTNDVSLSSSSMESISTNVALCIGKDDVKHLLALLHAANCTSNKCSVLPDSCHDMKLLYRHSKKCKKICKYDNCYTSRVLLTHYAHCIDMECQICLPTRLSLHNRNICAKPRRRGIVIDDISSQTGIK